MIADIWRVVREWRVYFEEFGVDAAEMDKPRQRFVTSTISRPPSCASSYRERPRAPP
jgi:hypothetical protein